jgi:hypothetical protein
MEKNPSSKTVLLCDKQLDQRVDGQRYLNPPVSSTNITEKQLIWSSSKQDDWEILVYKLTDCWEACFFRWPIHHEHATGSSFDAVRRRAEQRIQILEGRRLRDTRFAGNNSLTVST